MTRATLPKKGTRLSRCEMENVRRVVTEHVPEDAVEVVSALHGGDRLTATDLYPNDPEARERVLHSLDRAGVLKRMRGSKIRGSASNPIWSTYSLAIPLLTDEQVACATRLLRRLDSRIALAADGYLARNKGILLDNEQTLLELDAWLAERGCDSDEVGVRERSWEVFGDEKALTEGDTPRLLFSILGIDPSLLRYHETSPNDFPFRYDATRAGAVVVSENQDMWDSLSRLIEKGPFRLFGVKVVGAIFGGGNFARGDDGLVLAAFLARRGIDPARCLYVGDIDPAGIAIQQSVEDACGIHPWTGMYAAMCASHEAARVGGRAMEPHAEQVGAYDRDRFLSVLDERSAREAARALDAHARIPQEAVGLHDMEEAAVWLD